MARRSKRKPSKRKLLGANNSCCPVIHLKCALTKGKKTRIPSMDYRDVRYEYVGGGKKVCTVSLGKRAVLTRVSQEKVNKKMG